WVTFVLRINPFPGAVPAEALPLLPLAPARRTTLEARWGQGGWVTGAEGGGAAHLGYVRGAFVESARPAGGGASVLRGGGQLVLEERAARKWWGHAPLGGGEGACSWQVPGEAAGEALEVLLRGGVGRDGAVGGVVSSLVEVAAFSLTANAWGFVALDGLRPLDHPTLATAALLASPLPPSTLAAIRALAPAPPPPSTPPSTPPPPGRTLTAQPQRTALPSLLLFHGPPSSGKGSAAALLAALAHRPLLRLAASRLVPPLGDAHLGALREALRLAGDWGAVLLLEDAEALALDDAPAPAAGAEPAAAAHAGRGGAAAVRLLRAAFPDAAASSGPIHPQPPETLPRFPPVDSLGAREDTDVGTSERGAGRATSGLYQAALDAALAHFIGLLGAAVVPADRRRTGSWDE
ncbi:hypothetical protein T484DRAFT_1771503, partial [Baffinella frigidus]